MAEIGNVTVRVDAVITDEQCREAMGAVRAANERMDRLESENAKLRELAAGIGYLLFALDVDYCVACPRDDINHPCPVHTIKGGECLYKTDLRELGIEVES